MNCPRSEVCAIVPVKRFSAAKSRLKKLLDPAARIDLSRAMLEDVLYALSGLSGRVSIRIVSADPDAATIAWRYGAQTVLDRQEAGTSAAVAQGIASLPQRWTRVLVMPADIPFVTESEIDRVLAALPGSGVVLVPAERDGGTNMLAMAAASQITPQFGEGSFERHVAAARAASIEPAVIRLSGAGHDIDMEADLRGPMPCAEGTRTRHILEQFVASGLMALTPSSSQDALRQALGVPRSQINIPLFTKMEKIVKCGCVEFNREAEPGRTCEKGTSI